MKLFSNHYNVSNLRLSEVTKFFKYEFNSESFLIVSSRAEVARWVSNVMKKFLNIAFKSCSGISLLAVAAGSCFTSTCFTSTCFTSNVLIHLKLLHPKIITPKLLHLSALGSKISANHIMAEIFDPKSPVALKGSNRLKSCLFVTFFLWSTDDLLDFRGLLGPQIDDAKFEPKNGRNFWPQNHNLKVQIAQNRASSWPFFLFWLSTAATASDFTGFFGSLVGAAQN